ncbi:MAG: hypothetical protein ACRDGT_04065 [Candidatus Limnocylindria bacterium]
MAAGTLSLRQRVMRRDVWWLEPLVIAGVLGTFVVYSTFAALANAHYYVAPYLSPLYSPCISANCAHLTFGVPVIGEWWNLAPAIWILGFPLAFRATCYYYRRSYYRAFFLAPPACAVPDVRSSYGGETKFPFVLQNIHRYAWYAAVVFIFILSYDALLAFTFPTASGVAFGVGLGTVMMTTNVVLLALYTFSCHSCRHLCGGFLDRFQGRPFWYRLWSGVTRLNARHGLFAWLSLFGVALTDLYIRLLSMGVIPSDPRILF